ncbi:MAG TPA: polyprenyl synthetase family protein [Actinomycetota bacterium]|nr:polyprenyl synthetase family protein [Actinomycetota bacterium]
MTRAAIRGLEAPDPAVERELRGRLDEVEEALAKAVRSDSEFVSETSAYLSAAGGKRFRSRLVLLSGYFGDPVDPRLIQGAVAIEITHIATLYHDDVIDEADMRHGRPSVNARWDNTVAILAGDLLFAKASELSAELGTEVSRLLARTIATLCDGQIRDVAASGRIDQDERSYMEIIERKTAALIATSCRLGGMMSDAPLDAVERLDDVGMALGMAFQLSDDIMDFTASEEELGKQPGQDIRQGVYTLPVLFALHDGAQGGELSSLLAEGPPHGEALDRALSIVRADRSLHLARAAVGRHVRRAKDLATGLTPGPARDALVHIAEFLAARCGARA